MNEVKLNPSAVSVHPNRLSLTLEVGFRDAEGNTVQVMPLSCENLCYPFGANVDAVVGQIVQRLQEQIRACRQQLESAEDTGVDLNV